MAKRGPKTRNVAGGMPGRIRAADLEPCSLLSQAARAEFLRLAEALERLGALGRADLAVLTEAARIKGLLDRAHDLVDFTEPATIKVLNVLTSQRRGLLRELGLTLQPSRSVVRTNAEGPEDVEEDPVRRYIKIRG